MKTTFRVDIKAKVDGDNLSFCVVAPGDVFYLSPARYVTPLWEIGLMGAKAKRLQSDTPTECWAVKQIKKNQRLVIEYDGFRTGIVPSSIPQSILLVKPARGVTIDQTYAAPYCFGAHRSSLYSPSCNDIPSGNVFSQGPIVYLQQTSDRYQHTVDVYTDADAAGNHFVARGRFNIFGSDASVPPMDEISTNAPCFGITCITAQFISNGSNWGGWYWLNGVLGPADRQPALNWGDHPNAGFDLSGATSFQFWARGANGGEDVASVYDNAVTLIALSSAGDLQCARTIADALLYAQSHDRFFTDSRLRNGYQGGDIMLPPGWVPNNKPNTVRMPGWYDPAHGTWYEDQFQVSTNTGNIAWAMLALLNFYEATHEQKYLQAVDKLGDWIIANTADTRGSGGFTGGYEGWENGAASGSSSTCASGVLVNGQCKRLYKATEHNIDLYAAFSRLYAAENLQKWATAAQNAKTLFLSMWDPNEGKFWTGTTEDGITISKDVIPLDIQAWAIQALGSAAGPYVQSLNYVEAHHKTTLGYGFKQNGGNSCGDNTWFEGSSQVAVSYSLAGNRSKWQSILNGIHSVQVTSGAMPATGCQCLNTGFFLNDGQPWEYFPRTHVGATAWLSFAEMGVNPLSSGAVERAAIRHAVPLKVAILDGGGIPLSVISTVTAETEIDSPSQSQPRNTIAEPLAVEVITRGRTSVSVSSTVRSSTEIQKKTLRQY